MHPQVAQILQGVERSMIVKLVAIYMAIVGVLNLCGGILTGLAGTIAGIASLGMSSAAREVGAIDAEAGAALGAAGALGLLGAVVGIALIITGPVMLAAAFGLFQRLSWARMLTVIIAGIGALLALLSFLSGGGLGQLVSAVLSGFIAYVFYYDPEIKAMFGAA